LGSMRMPSWRTFPNTPTSNRPFRSAKSRSSLQTQNRGLQSSSQGLTGQVIED
jgi:hypothetical protein